MIKPLPASASESDVQLQIRLELSKLGLTLFRNNVGMGWTGNATHPSRGTVIIKNARPLHAGLHKGSSDLIGWTSVTITPEMLGTKLAVFTAVECKRAKGGVISADQSNFLNKLMDSGGIGFVARSAEDAVEGLNRWRTRKP